MTEHELKRAHFRRSASYLGLALLLSAGSRAIPQPAVKWVVLALGLVPLVIGLRYYVLAMGVYRAAKRAQSQQH